MFDLLTVKIKIKDQLTRLTKKMNDTNKLILIIAQFIALFAIRLRTIVGPDQNWHWFKLHFSSYAVIKPTG